MAHPAELRELRLVCVEHVKARLVPRVGNTMKFSFSCTRPPSSGEGEVTFDSPQAYQSRIQVKTSAAGKADQMAMRSQGKWLSADCGNVKPMAAGRK